jgi:hypothetical protein
LGITGMDGRCGLAGRARDGSVVLFG